MVFCLIRIVGGEEVNRTVKTIEYLRWSLRFLFHLLLYDILITLNSPYIKVYYTMIILRCMCQYTGSLTVYTSCISLVKFVHLAT